MPLRKDIWRPAIIDAPVEQIIAQGGIEGFPCTWLPEMPPFQFLADPFALKRDGVLHVFVETYDYRVRVGAIELLRYDSAFRLLDRRLVLSEPWHLSYPIVWEADGETWMLPEAHRSGKLTLYRAAPFPSKWVAEAVIDLDRIPVDATPFFHEGRWWLFYAGANCEEDKTGALFAAYADTLTGPWTPHPLNPVRRGHADTRPGGSVAWIDGKPVLPTQDCRETYGGAIHLLHIDVLTPDAFAAHRGRRIEAPDDAEPCIEGLHTLSGFDGLTLVDCKRTELSLRGLAIEVRREFGKLMKRFG